MKRVIALACVVLLLGVSSMGYGAEAVLDSDGMLVVDGERVFVLGMYENPKEDADLADLAAAGFNLVRASEEAGSLNRLHAHGLGAWVNTGSRIDLSDAADARRAGLEDMVAKAGGHRALLVWEVPDEALWNTWYRAMQWRSQEPGKLRELIAALEDKGKAAALRKKLAASTAEREAGNWAASEKLADGIWEDLGEASPHPGFGLADAPAREAKLCAGMLAGYRHLKEIDPHHPVWMNHAPRNQLAQLAAFNAGADIAGCDIYPVPDSRLVSHSDLPEQSVAAVGAYTARMQDAAPGKPVWMVLQGFGWGDIQPNKTEEERKELRRPTFAESRFMAYDAIVRGARGILYWGTHAIEKDSQLWAELLCLGAELDALQPMLSANDAALEMDIRLAPSYGSLERTVYVLPKQVGEEVWFLVVNETTSALSYTLEGLASLEGTAYEVQDTELRATVEEGALSFGIPRRAVQILLPGAP